MDYLLQVNEINGCKQGFSHAETNQPAGTLSH